MNATQFAAFYDVRIAIQSGFVRLRRWPVNFRGAASGGRGATSLRSRHGLDLSAGRQSAPSLKHSETA
jgi:hypothetical protein